MTHRQILKLPHIELTGDDSNSNINPNSLEIQDGLDNNCDGSIDEIPLEELDGLNKWDSLHLFVGLRVKQQNHVHLGTAIESFSRIQQLLFEHHQGLPTTLILDV